MIKLKYCHLDKTPNGNNITLSHFTLNLQDAADMLNVWVANMAKMLLSGGQRQNGKKGVAAAAA